MKLMDAAAAENTGHAGFCRGPGSGGAL